MPKCKVGKDIFINWEDLMSSGQTKIEGWSSASEIAQKTGCGLRIVRDRLEKSRFSNQVECKRVLLKGHLTWVYKDKDKS